MSAREGVIRPISEAPSVPIGAALAAGLLLLLGRQLTGSGPVLLLVLGTLAAVSVIPAIHSIDRPTLPSPVVTIGGLALVTIAAATQGSKVPTPTAAWVLPLGLVAAVAEEAFFRRLVYGGLRRIGVTAAIAGSALLFAAVHVPAYGWPAFPVDLGAGLLFGWQRWTSGTWAVPAATHAAANLLAVLR